MNQKQRIGAVAASKSFHDCVSYMYIKSSEAVRCAVRVLRAPIDMIHIFLSLFSSKYSGPSFLCSSLSREEGWGKGDDMYNAFFFKIHFNS